MNESVCFVFRDWRMGTHPASLLSCIGYVRLRVFLFRQDETPKKGERGCYKINKIKNEHYFLASTRRHWLHHLSTRSVDTRGWWKHTHVCVCARTHPMACHWLVCVSDACQAKDGGKVHMANSLRGSHESLYLLISSLCQQKTQIVFPYLKKQSWLTYIHTTDGWTHALL